MLLWAALFLPLVVLMIWLALFGPPFGFLALTMFGANAVAAMRAAQAKGVELLVSDEPPAMATAAVA